MEQRRLMNSEIQRDTGVVRSVMELTFTNTTTEALRVLKGWSEKFVRETIPMTVIDQIQIAEGPNARQVGGAHYASELQHWDVIEDYGIGYLEGCASKYVTRARKKNGLQDVDKAIHYVEKLIEKHSRIFDISNPKVSRQPRGSVPLEVTLEFIRKNGLTDLEGAICALLFTWRDRGDLEKTLQLINRLRDHIASSSPATAARDQNDARLGAAKAPPGRL